jgi:hypothetical protein
MLREMAPTSPTDAEQAFLDGFACASGWQINAHDDLLCVRAAFSARLQNLGLTLLHRRPLACRVGFDGWIAHMAAVLTRSREGGSLEARPLRV